MSNEINTEQILQAISELSEEIKGVSAKIDNVEERLNEKIIRNAEKIDNFEAKFSIISDNLLHTQAEVKQLKDAK